MTSSACSRGDGRVVAFLRLIRFSHSLFALPYAIAGFVLGLRETPRSGGALVGGAAFALMAIICARTAAMLFNRLVDRRFDATNPRTRMRASVSGDVSPRAMTIGVVASGAGFVAASFLLNPLCGWLAFVALAVILGYSYAKRVTAWSHVVLGAALGLAPVGAYLAAAGSFGPATWGVVSLACAVLCWTAGFDVLYACQDVEHDRREGLHSIPAALGVPAALVVARVFHALVLVALLVAGRLLGMGIVYMGGVVAAGVLLVVEHALVRADDLSRLQTAFFHVNVLVSVVVMFAVVLDIVVA